MNKKSKGIIAVVLVGCLAVGGVYAWQNSQPNEENLVPVEVGAIQSLIKEPGEIHSHQVSKVFSDFSQKAAHVPVAIGDHVKAGGVLLIYDDVDDLTQARLVGELSALKEQQRLNQAGSELELSNLQIATQKAQDQLQKLEALAEAGAISQQELIGAKQAAQLAENQYLAAENAALLSQSQYQAQADTLNNQLSALAKNKEGLVVTAPFDGVVTELNVQSGSMTQPGLAVVEIQNPADLYIKVNLLVEDAQQIQLGTAVIAQDEQSGIYQDQLIVSKIYPKATVTLSALGVEQKRTPVEIDLPPLDKSLPLGADLDLSFLVAEKTDALLVPKKAVYSKAGEYFVRLADQTEQAVTIGLKQGEKIEIIDGLQAGQMIQLNDN